jgi:hypothetical protein
MQKSYLYIDPPRIYTYVLNMANNVRTYVCPFFHRTRSSKRSTRPAERLECVWERLYRPKAWQFFYCNVMWGAGGRRKDRWSSQLYGRNPKESTETYQTMSLFIGMFDLNNLSWSLLIPTETFVHTPYSNVKPATC